MIGAPPSFATGIRGPADCAPATLGSEPISFLGKCDSAPVSEFLVALVFANYWILPTLTPVFEFAFSVRRILPTQTITLSLTLAKRRILQTPTPALAVRRILPTRTITLSLTLPKRRILQTLTLVLSPTRRILQTPIFPIVLAFPPSLIFRHDFGSHGISTPCSL